MTATQEPTARRAIVLRLPPTPRTLLLFAIVAVAVSLSFPIVQRLREPVY
jgi:hypothetical protein